ncbi:MAG: CRISPR-associated endonuclease Cas1, partial [Planctomycetes bacterium]|nr:CRISPR-associated endonuclease Cas1 [Planctomycetota bacterium]
MHTLAISEQGTAIHAEADTLALYRGKNLLRRVRVAELDQLLLFGRIELSSGAVALLVRRGVDVAWLTRNGLFRGRLLGRYTKHVALRLTQYRRATDPEFCVRIARTLITAKIHQQRQLLLRAQRKLQDQELAEALGQLRLLTDRARDCNSLDSLRGLEGAAAATYFGQFGKLLRNDKFRFNGRNRRPPLDEVNAMLSFGYAVLGSTIETELYRCGLDPLLGFFHQPAYGRASLMLDLLEEFRPTVDGLVLRVVNRRQ